MLSGRNKSSPPAADLPSKTPATTPVSQDPAQKTNDNVQVPPEEEPTLPADSVSEEIVTETGPNGGSGSSDGRPRARGRPAGPKKRQGAKAKEETLHPEEVPEWFINRSVRLLEESIASPGDSKATIVSSSTEYLPSRLPGAWPPDALSDLPTDGDFKKALHAGQQRYQLYYLEENVWREIVATAKAGLMVSKPSSAHSLAAMKSHCILHSPCRGGVYHLDAVVNRIAEDVEADVVRIDPLDLEEMVGDSVGDSRLGAYSVSMLLDPSPLLITLLQQLHLQCLRFQSGPWDTTPTLHQKTETAKRWKIQMMNMTATLNNLTPPHPGFTAHGGSVTFLLRSSSRQHPDSPKCL